MSKSANIDVSLSISLDGILGEGFPTGLDGSDIKNQISDSIEFELCMSYEGDDNTLVEIDLHNFSINEDNEDIVELSTRISINSIPITLESFSDGLKSFYLGLMSYFDKKGFNIVSSNAVGNLWNDGKISLDDLPNQPNPDHTYIYHNYQKDIDYILFRDYDSFTIDDSDKLCERFYDSSTDEDNTFRPRTTDEILGDIDDEDDED